MVGEPGGEVKKLSGNEIVARKNIEIHEEDSVSNDKVCEGKEPNEACDARYHSGRQQYSGGGNCIGGTCVPTYSEEELRFTRP